jgi:hypothetical protein
MSLAAGEGKAEKFLNSSQTEIAEFASSLEDTFLAHVLKAGIAFIYEGQEPQQRMIVEELYQANKIQVLIVSQTLCWETGNLKAYLTVVLDNSKYDGTEKRYVDYTVAEMVQMTSKFWNEYTPNSNKLEESSKALVLCAQSKKEFYKKFLTEPFPVESSLNLNLANHFNAEINSKTLK